MFWLFMKFLLIVMVVFKVYVIWERLSRRCSVRRAVTMKM